MRFNIEVGAGDYRLADVVLIGHIVDISLWMGNPAQAAESQYRLQFDENWPAKTENEKAHDAIRVAVADALARGFDPALVQLLPVGESARWPGRITDLAGKQ